MLDAVSTAVKNGTVWITSGAASVWGDAPPVGIISKTAVLRTPPDPISVSSLTPEALPDAWTDGKASVHSIEQALAAQRGVISLPWKLVEAAITAAMNSGFIRVIPGGVAWPCQPHEATAVQIGLALGLKLTVGFKPMNSSSKSLSEKSLYYPQLTAVASE